MVGSIDPRCETVRGTHWPEDRSCGCLELASRKPSWPAVQSDRTNRPDIWMQAIRSDLKNLLCHGGRPHMGPGSRPGRHKGPCFLHIGSQLMYLDNTSLALRM